VVFPKATAVLVFEGAHDLALQSNQPGSNRGGIDGAGIDGARIDGARIGGMGVVVHR
jgi:hypothetical protein